MMLTYAGAYLKHRGDYFKTKNDKLKLLIYLSQSVNDNWALSENNRNVANSSQTYL